MLRARLRPYARQKTGRRVRDYSISERDHRRQQRGRATVLARCRRFRLLELYFPECYSDASPAMISGLTLYSPVIPIKTKEVKIAIFS